MGSEVQEYWLPGYRLSRHIVLRQMQYFLGPSVRIRPYSYQGREGYLIHGTPLTKEQIEDLRRQSEEYERQESMRMNRRRDDSGDTDINEPVIVGKRASGYSSYRPYR